MNKQSIRAFGFGLLAASAALFISGQMLPEQPAELSTQQMIQRLKAENYVIQNNSVGQAQNQADAVQKEKNTQKTITNKPVTFVIETGMSSNEIAAQLKKSGIIEDPASFNQFLTKNGYADKLQVGSFTLKTSMTQKEVADTLTK
ncbi:endolytic transglycosylase MltG [Domibacillus robiginosus]|uniref:endolytic transglycosylase MltG n=1 Tax=Domibacillus robiginosus TaxID=1071054 RepID=UPI00067E1A9C|nr:endolytic transglycosylase MltG [Domibacillus robiginosus]